MKKIVFLALFFFSAFAFSSEAGVKNPAKSLSSVGERQNYLPILNRWAGDYPIAQLDRIKECHAQGNGGYIDDEATFARFWETFKNGTAVPKVDFGKNLVVFFIGGQSDKQMFIAKVTIKVNIAEMVADGNTSGPPPEGSLAMALAVIPKAGVKFLQVGSRRIAVE